MEGKFGDPVQAKFEGFGDIKKLGNAALYITQKIHGTNAQIYIVPSSPDKHGHPNLVDVDGLSYELYVGSRTRWIAPGDDNYGFAQHVYANKEEFIRKLGPGRHYGEWAGPGINSGEGLKEKTFILFDHWKYPEGRPLPPQTVIVPVLYSGQFDLGKVQETMDDLKTNGSKLVPGYMRPEGIVVRIKGERYKVVFQAEETKWKDADPEYQKQKSQELDKALETYGHLLQPIRLEKLLSRDEQYVRDYPKSMGKIVKDYFADLVKEDQVKGTEVEINGIRKQLGGHLFKFVQQTVEKQNVG